MKKIVFIVINDFVTDQRLIRITNTLSKNGYNVEVVCRKFRTSPKLDIPIKVKRFKFLFNKGALFYAFFNIRVFLYLLFTKVDIIVANDIDTVPASYFAAKLRAKKIVIDCHELFPEVPELVNRKFIKNIWQSIESFFIRRIKHGYTVCQSIASHYRIKYKVNYWVIRNLPLKNNHFEKLERIPEAKDKIIIYQGALNIGRGIEKTIKAMKYLNNFTFLIIGTGDIEDELKILVKELKVEEKVVFTGRLMPKHINNYTQKADIGISLEENIGLNYYYALPNKIFDYINAEVPVLCSDFPEMSKIITDYNLGNVTLEDNPKQLALIINDMVNSSDYNTWKHNCKKAKDELCWEKEEAKLLDFYQKLFSN